MTDEPTNGRQILIVEDETMIAIMLEDMLDELGYGVAGVAAKTPQALELIDSVPIDAAILDLNLAGQDSYDIAAALEERGVPFLFSTGYAALAVEERYRERPFLQKPFRQEELQKALSGMLKS
jgi:CheY-like chemotaxis protein